MYIEYYRVYGFIFYGDPGRPARLLRVPADLAYTTASYFSAGAVQWEVAIEIKRAIEKSARLG